MSKLLLQRLLNSRKAITEERDAIFAAVEQRAAADTETRAASGDKGPGPDPLSFLTDEETTKLTELRGRIETIDAEVEPLRQQALADERAAAAAEQLSLLRGGSQSSPAIRIKSEPTTYRQAGEHSWVRDLARAVDRGTSDERAMERLQRHRQEMEVLYREAGSEMEFRTNMNRTDGQGGEFVPPLWLLNQYLPIARAGRVTADLCRRFPLPGGTDSINIPKISSGTTTGQVADNNAPSNTDMATTSVSGHVETTAGQQVVAMQLLDQSPVSMDEIIFQDLLASHAVTLCQQVISGSGSAPQLRGIRNVASLNTVTYTDSDATLPELYPKVIKAQADVAAARYLPAQAYVMHPRRWAWMIAQLDSTNRPFIVPNAQGPVNAFAGFGDVRAEGSVGSIGGLPVYIDANMPTNVGTGENEDVILCCRFDDLYLYEGPLRTRVLFETDANTLQVRFQLWSYNTFIGGRYPGSISVITGTGLTAVLT